MLATDPVDSWHIQGVLLAFQTDVLLVYCINLFYKSLGTEHAI